MNQTGPSKTEQAFDATAAAVCLSMVQGIGPRLFQQLIESFETPASVLAAAPEQLKRVPGIGPKLVDAIVTAKENNDWRNEIDVCRKQQIDIVTREDEEYPKLLKKIVDPPNVLYSRGSLVPQDEIAIAIVGTRHATAYGKSQAERLARELSHAGYTIVSGLARGIDAAAHRAALQAGGRTIAVLGSGLLNIYPPEHQQLANEIIANGALVSELSSSRPPKSGSFPQRNRIITGLSLGVVVVEAAQRSGALISARLATEQDREVFAVPGRVDSRNSRGCNGLIRRSEAKLIESVDDVLEEFGPLQSPVKGMQGEKIHHPAELQLNEQEKKILNAIEVEPTDMDQIVARTGLPINRVLSTVSILEMKRLIKRVSGTSVMRI
jgi:DNA processing protein